MLSMNASLPGMRLGVSRAGIPSLQAWVQRISCATFCWARSKKETPLRCTSGIGCQWRWPQQRWQSGTETVASPASLNRRWVLSWRRSPKNQTDPCSWVLGRWAATSTLAFGAGLRPHWQQTPLRLTRSLRRLPRFCNGFKISLCRTWHPPRRPCEARSSHGQRRDLPVPLGSDALDVLFSTVQAVVSAPLA